MITTKCPECGSGTWRASNGGFAPDNIHRICDDCGQEYFTNIDYSKIEKRCNMSAVKPGYYKNLKIQPSEYCQLNNLGGLESAVVKYVTRHLHKGGKSDILKAIHCLEMLNEYVYKDELTASEISDEDC